MRGHSTLNRIMNAAMREKVRTMPMEDKIKETRMRWFSRIKRSDINTPVQV